MVVAALRDFAEWDAHPQGQAVAGLPPLLVERIGDAPPVALPAIGWRPLAGVRVLDLTRVIAGPVCGRTLAAHGAEVLHITGPHLPSIGPLVMDTGRGKRCAHLDLRAEADRETLRALARGADVFVQGYRPGGISGLGFSPEALAELQPGIVCVSLSAYGHVGPWAGKRGFDSLVQTATGINAAEAAAEGRPGEARPLPCQALDHASGYLLALGAMAALLRRAEEGGSWLVRVSLAGTGRWLRGVGRVEGGLAAADTGMKDVADLLETTQSPLGRIEAVRHAARLSRTAPYWADPPVALGTHPAAWRGA
jgi:crotonobetainyl-CoA:carnitine CoA-transferase CaiB-like acyl-CoA transferase